MSDEIHLQTSTARRSQSQSLAACTSLSTSAALLLALATFGTAITAFYVAGIIWFRFTGVAGFAFLPVVGMAVGWLTAAFVRQTLSRVLSRSNDA